MIRIRDVTFDEASFFNPGVEALRLQVKQVDAVVLADILNQPEAMSPSEQDSAHRNDFEDTDIIQYDVLPLSSDEKSGDQRQAREDSQNDIDQSSLSQQKDLIPPEANTTAYLTPPDSPAGLLAATMNRPWIREATAFEGLANRTSSLSRQDDRANDVGRSLYGPTASYSSTSASWHVQKGKDMSPLGPSHI